MAIWSNLLEGAYDNDDDIMVTPDENSDIIPTMEGSDAILLEANEDSYKINAALYIADIAIENSILNGKGPDEVNVLIEGVIKGTLDKIINSLKTFWKHIQEWFSGVLENIKVLTSSGEKFIAKYGTLLEEKVSKVKNFTYDGYLYDYGAVKTFAKTVTDKAETMSHGVSNPSGETAEDIAKSVGEVATLEKSKFVEAIVSSGNAGSNTIADMKKHMTFIAHKKDSSHKSRSIDAGQVKEMIETVRGNKAMIEELKVAKGNLDGMFKNIISGFSKLKNKADGSTPIDGISSVISKMESNAKAALSVSQAVASTQIAIRKEMYGAHLSVLKRLATHKEKGSTASPTPEDESTKEGFNLFESAFNLI